MMNKPDKEKEHSQYISWCEEINKERAIKSFFLRKEKAGKNPFKKWFYLGEKTEDNLYIKAPFDKLRYKSFVKWANKAFKNGVKISMPWFTPNIITTKIVDNILDFVEDYDDIYKYIIVKCTIQGLYLGLYGRQVENKEDMHNLWMIRKEAIKALYFEDYYYYKNGIDFHSDDWQSTIPKDFYDKMEKEMEKQKNKVFKLVSKYLYSFYQA